jgi:hypothetical protein
LRAEEARLLLASVFLLPLTCAALRWLGLHRWQMALARFSPLPRETVWPRDERHAWTAARCVAAAAARVAPGDTCLSQALVLWWLLRRRGLDSGLRLGVRKSADRLSAHAWIEYRGLNLGPRPDASQSYTPFPALITPYTRRSA